MNAPQGPRKTLDGVLRPDAQPPGDSNDQPASVEEEIVLPVEDDATSEPQAGGFSDPSFIEIEEEVSAPPEKQSLKARLGNYFTRLKNIRVTKKRAAFTAVGLLVLAGGFFAFRIWWAGNQIIVRNNGDGAYALQDDADLTKLKGEGDGRVNILLIGIGGDEHKAGDLADSIMLVSLDPFSKDVAILSIPRDLHLEIPGYGSTKVNAAHAYGEEYNHPGGGPALLKETLTQALDVPIHYYVRADFTGFNQAINTVGGIEVNVEESIYDYAYPDSHLSNYEPFNLEAGRRYMDGETALKYARSRYTTSDFDRSKRQRQILIALKDKAVSLGTLSNPLKVNSLIEAAGNHVRTDLQMDELVKLINISKEVRNEQIISVGLDNSPDNFLASANVGGVSALVPKAGDFSEIQRYVRGLLTDGYIKKEGASVEVLNGTDRAGLATEVAELLKSYGYNVVRVGDAPAQDFARTEIYDYSNGSKPYTVNYLEKRFGATVQRRSSQENGGAEITVIVGHNYNGE